ncbi:MAG: AbrB/MazE/SpoVT family DNA-binding domain-containing protein [Firmicutes bacterium]|nr:AbrB/MazE/SpoVT family DNA-binding domain-containing protein [Bacillota bacterium]
MSNSRREGTRVKSTGIVRRVDELGRVVLPIELRRTLNISDRDSLEIYVDGEKIVLKKYEPACIFCGNAEGIETFRGKNICHTCLKDLLHTEAV